MADAPDLPELLDVDVQQIARTGPLVALHHARGLERRQAVQPRAAQARDHGRPRDPVVRREADRAPALGARLHDLSALMARELPGQMMGTGGAIRQGRWILLRAPDPRPDRPDGDPMACGDLRRRCAGRHGRDHRRSPRGRQASMLVDVHGSLWLGAGCVS